ncbi:MAG: response regulator, partial [Candidatus Syntropharchaeia archaeon]
FKIYLPAFSMGQENEVEEKISLEEFQGSGERILVVEDEGGVREFTTLSLRENGYVVSEAGSVREALEIFEKENMEFDLVFTDVVLPDGSGIQLAEEFLSKKPGLSVILSSGYTDHKSQWSLIREKGYPFLQKPYTLRDLLKAVKDAVQH